MMTITSPAGRRLARAKAAMDDAGMALFADKNEPTPERKIAIEYIDAAKAVADELIAQRFHLCEGD